MLIVLAALVLLASGRLFKIQWDIKSQAVTLYTSNNSQVKLKLSFQQQQLSLLPSLKGESLFLQKGGKGKLLALQDTVHYDYHIRAGTIDDDFAGIIGLKQKSSFFQVLEGSFKKQCKLAFKRKEGVIMVEQQACHYPIFAPFSITLSETTTHSYSISTPAMTFHPDSYFLKILGKDHSPFELTANQLKEEITATIRDRITSVPLKDLLPCGKYQNSQSYQCQVSSQTSSNPGGLLFLFDPVLCKSGIQLHESIDESWGFHYSHIILLILQFLLLFVLAKQELIVDHIKRIVEKKRR